MHILKQEQYLGSSLSTAWGFLKNPYNLNDITPPDLDFKIISHVPEEMYNGLIIEYLITLPLFGPQKWVTEIKHIQPFHSFVDEQRLGPYKFWYHYHQIEEDNGRIKSIDLVYYQPPYGQIGKILHALYIRKNLERIFTYRRAKLKEILG